MSSILVSALHPKGIKPGKGVGKTGVFPWRMQSADRRTLKPLGFKEFPSFVEGTRVLAERTPVTRSILRLRAENGAPEL